MGRREIRTCDSCRNTSEGAFIYELDCGHDACARCKQAHIKRCRPGVAAGLRQSGEGMAPESGTSGSVEAKPQKT